MNALRKILFPFSVLYGIVTAIRNFLFDIGVLKSYSFAVPTIVVGNLSVGGTGKSPQIEYLIRLLEPNYKVVTLSRGYKRKTEGFVLADATASASTIGDEPYQFYSKFKSIRVAVDANRKNGIETLLAQKNKPEIILLDDAYQHRKVKAGLYILLTTYKELYCDDYLLPAGNLRESRSGAKRAKVVIVTKCPPTLSVEEQKKIKAKLKMDDNQELYFSYIKYDDLVFSEQSSIKREVVAKQTKVLLAGIAKPDSFFEFLKGENDICLSYPDHHDFTYSDLATIKNKAGSNIVVTTEKDYVRLKGRLPMQQLFYLPIQSAFINEGQNFNKTINDYVG
ncbi:tetraacyldisaccharide 4'-kinase [Flavobacterium sp.]|uniref:tetraacyldisaccharide 4'-kinase n=1 Tax=Flavobacterium sp. TaxID=239 RepID=UPI0026137953|nr:tetraacyldisaccharide 4'-kinase [Flavobacterium sp.]MDG2431257.1 tetraacyldisaccharide 4'-kinase [Flavobacterium sp.]